MIETKDDGKPFGPYRLLKNLGIGGMGEVWLAEEPAKAHRLVVVKMLRGHLVADREYVARFLDEVRLVVLLEHPNICRVFDSGSIERRYYLSMEFVPGWDARTLVERASAMGDPLPEDLALFVLANILDALAYAHEKKSPENGAPLRLVHRDVSPQNVMIGFEGEVKLIDFGLAASTVKQEVTRPEVVMGKLQYMSPEHARGDRVDATADQFAAAMVGYELLLGESYYGNMSQHEIWHVAGVGGFVPPSWSALDGKVQDVLKKALATDPKDRYPSCAAFKEALVKTMRARGLKPTASDLSRFLKDLYVAHIGEEAERTGGVPAEIAYVARASVPEREAPDRSETGVVAREESRPPPPSSPPGPRPPPSAPPADETLAEDTSRTAPHFLAGDTVVLEVMDRRTTDARMQSPHASSSRLLWAVAAALTTLAIVAAGVVWWLTRR